eukprot:CAMPEP_0168737430 /NCGR_PEP_ID=MMETSP0724-20121128/10392_1 /TAXON_ID=265536 /ORGANISM="Amphiprora sp., Strain CCMP467" /LENGTH=405 /DNA_ID=CAMNT_0008784699 /DNA_START=128 /DNA_END=1345 /DNA_ORIENTATION=-
MTSVEAFLPTFTSSSVRTVVATTTTTTSSLSSSPNNDDNLKNIMAEQGLDNAEMLKENARRMKDMTPQDLYAMLSEMDSMPASQKEQLKSMGMDPEIMKSTMKMMKDNPEMIGKMSEVMETMTPEELVEQSRMAQQNFGFMAPKETTSDSVVDAVIEEDEEEEDEEEEDEEEEEEEEEPIEPNPEVLDAMYRVAEIMSTEGSGITFAAFSTIPPIALLTGTGDDDVTKKELSECWNKGSLGASRIDRDGFERVWRLVQENYYNDIVEEAQERTLVQKKKRKRGASKPAAATPAVPATPQVGAAISQEQLADSVKNLKDEDMTAMFEQMTNMSPAEEERMRAMGVDPAMMKKSAQMMKNNPLLRKAATAMMKNTPADKLMEASRQAQEKMASMSEAEKQRMLDNLK